MSSIPVVFFGNERLATGVTTSAPTLRTLIEAGYDIRAVVSNYERGTSRSARNLEIKEIADNHSIPLLLPEKPIQIANQLKAFGAEVGVLVAYGKIVPQIIIDIFPKGIVNIHPSLLPLHRGPTPIESVILNGESKTGVSVMSLVKEMDAGPVYGQKQVNLTGRESKQELADKLLTIGSEMIIELLPNIIKGSLVAQDQENHAATYDSLITKDTGLIDWNKSAKNLEREVRAFREWPKSRTTIGGKEVIITAAHAVSAQLVDAKPGDVDIADQAGEFGFVTGDGTLWIDRLKPAGKNEMPAKAFLAGYKHLFSL